MKILSIHTNSIADCTIILHFSTDISVLACHNHVSPFLIKLMVAPLSVLKKTSI